tara:strand:+ start:66 stop:419 length:354 start_codon:yes stop_codon:yes gene_type:complete
MKKLLIFLFSFFLLSSHSVFASYSDPQKINCEIENFEGVIEYDYFLRKNGKFIWNRSGNMYPVNITFENDSYLFLNLAFDSISVNIGFNKKNSKILLDAMNLEEPFLMPHAEGKCTY